MKSRFFKMSQAAFAAYSPKNELEMEEYQEEARFREWCKEHGEDPEAEESRESYEEEETNHGDAAWNDMDDDERQGWEHNMNKD